MLPKFGKTFALPSNLALLLLCIFCVMGSAGSFSCSRKSGCPAVDTVSSRIAGGKEMPKAKRSKNSGLFPKGFKR